MWKIQNKHEENARKEAETGDKVTEGNSGKGRGQPVAWLFSQRLREKAGSPVTYIVGKERTVGSWEV